MLQTLKIIEYDKKKKGNQKKIKQAYMAYKSRLNIKLKFIE